MRQLIGQTITRRYQIKSLLGKQRGRRTFLAEDIETRALVVLKLILFGPDFTWEDLKLFEREAETLKSLNHAAIPKYLDSFEVETDLGKGFVLVQTYIEARSLQDWMTSGRRFSEPNLKEIAQSILVILQYLHSRHSAVVHRDIKPSNILMGDYTAHSAGKIYLVDFGSVQVAQHGGTMTVVGTYGYMPPEQFGGRATPASDLYSLGATLVYLATGQHPADLGENSLAQAISTHPTLSSHFTHWIRQLTYAEAHKRISSAALAFHQLSHAPQGQAAIAPAAIEPSVEKASAKAIAPSASSRLALPNHKTSVSIADGAFIAQSDEQSLLLRFSQYRIREKFLTQQQPEERSKNSPNSDSRLFSFFLMAVLFMSLLLVAVSGSPAAVILIITSIIFVSIIIALLVKFSDSDFSQYPGVVEVALTKIRSDSINLTVEVSQGITSTDAVKSWNEHSRQPTQFIDVPMRSIKVVPDTFGYTALFIFSEDNKSVWNSQLSVSGSRRELKTLLRYIGEWDSTIVNPTTEYPFPIKELR